MRNSHHHFIAMKHWEVPLRLLLVLFIGISNAQDWSYSDIDDWGNQYPECNGDRQSPLQLYEQTADSSHFSVDFHDYEISQDATVLNTGQYVNITLPEDSENSPETTLTVSGQTSVYNLKSFAFCWPAEHEIEGIRHDMEMEMINMDEEGNTLMVSFIFKVCEQSEVSGFESIAPLFRTLNAGESTERSIAPINLLVPSNCSWFMYEGSLTYPPCTEGIKWAVQKNVICLTQDEIQAIREVKGPSGLPAGPNSRTAFPQGDREVDFNPCC